MSVPYDEPENVTWQTRIDAPPDDYALALADALETIFGRGIHDLEGIVAALNEDGPAPPGVDAWTPAVFEAEMVRLGA